MRGKQTQAFAVLALDISKLGVADADGVLQHGCKHWLKIARRTGNDLQHIRRSRLLLQRLGQVIGALAQLIQQAGVLDGDHSLIGEGRHELYLLFSKWVCLNAHEREDTLGLPDDLPSAFAGRPF